MRNDASIFLSLNELKRNYGLDIKVMDYLGVISAIPKSWLKEMGDQSKKWDQQLYNELQGREKITRIVYSRLTSERNLLFTKVRQYNVKNDANITQDELLRYIRRIKSYSIYKC